MIRAAGLAASSILMVVAACASASIGDANELRIESFTVTMARSPARPSTGRQRQVLALIARGLTNKEIAHELGITERGVSAHVSRLLARYNAPNRASLIARALADQVGRPSTTDQTVEVLTDKGILSRLEVELSGYENAPFFVGVTWGPNQNLVYQNRMSRELTGAIQVGGPHKEVFKGDPNQDWWREKGNEAFTEGQPVVVSSAPSRWQRSNGTWAEGVFDCVAQPVRDQIGSVRGVLWICAMAAS
jgi:DNA-binding CsgD family transcriptional regulator